MYRKQKKIPTILGLFLLFCGIGAAVYSDLQSQQLTTSAQLHAEAEDIHVTNISNNSFTVSWFTAQATNGTLTVNDGLNSTIHLDDRDSDAIVRPRTSHYITLSNLKEKTEYTVRIKIGNSACNSASCPIIKQKTGPALPPITTALTPAQGSILTETGNPATDAIIYVTIGKAAPLSTRVDQSGLWVTPFNNLRTQDLLSRPEISDSDVVQITAKTTTNTYSQAVIDMKSIRLNVTIPAMQLGKSYNFTDLLSKKDLFAGGTTSRILGSQTNRDYSTQQSHPIDLFFPTQEEDITTDNRPRFRGSGIVGNQILITVNSQSPQTDRVLVGVDGTWNWRPAKPLSPGIHHISIQGYDAGGKLVTLTRSFVVLKSGERVLGDATSSATLTPTLVVSPTPTSVTPTSSLPTVTGPISPSPSPTIAIFSPTPTLFVASVTQPFFTSTPIPTPPPSGLMQPVLFLAGGGMIFTLIGIKFLLAS